MSHVGRLAAIAVLLGSAGVVGACSGSAQDAGGSDSRPDTVAAGDTLPASEGAEDRPSGLAHVHGVGRDPRDGSILLATHYGLWRAGEAGEPELVGDYRHDLMGFSVVGAAHFVASGHPNGAPSLPSHLGLIESTDAGRTWKSVSLLGDVDFHALHASADQTWGWDSTTGRLMVSGDREEWDVRARDVMIVDFAVSPGREDTVVASMPVSETELQMRRSTDGGREFTPVDDAPQLARLTWGGNGLFGFDLEGLVWRSSNDGKSWQRVGEVGELPQAVAATDDELLAATRGAVQRSADGGRTWKRVVEFEV